MAIDSEGRWYAGIGDPSPVGWLAVAGYIVVALLAARNVAAARRSGATSSFWIAVTALMLLLGINKQLDLQTWFGQFGRDLALSQGWYEQRRTAQAAFIVLLAVSVVAGLLAVRARWAAFWSQYREVFGGIVLLALFVVFRAASFQHIDEIFGISLGPTQLHRVLEIAAVATVGVSCARWHRRHGRRPPDRYSIQSSRSGR